VNDVVSDVYGCVIFVPNAGQGGLPYATFDFVASDPYSTSSTAVVSIDVTGSTIIAIANGNNTITANTVWDIYGSPYWVQDTVSINTGGRLQIDAGVVVKFNNNTGITVNINGVLDVYGQLGNEVILTSINDDTYGGIFAGSTGTPGSAGSGYWNYVYYLSGAGTMQHVRLLHGGRVTAALYVRAASPTLDFVYIEDSGSSGLYIYAAPNTTASPLVCNLTVVNPAGNSVFDYGVYINAFSATASPVFSGSNSISGVLSGKYAIYLTQSGAAPVVNPSISGFTVDGGKYSVFANAGVSGTFTNNTFDGAAGGAIYLGSGTTLSMDNSNTIQNAPYPIELVAQTSIPAAITPTVDAATVDIYALAISGTFAAGNYALMPDPLGNGASQWLQTSAISLLNSAVMDIYAGTIFKRKAGNIAVNSGATLRVNGVRGNPVTFTSWNDDSVGSVVMGSSASPAMNEGIYLTYDAGSAGVMSFVNDFYASVITVRSNIPINDLYLYDSAYGLNLLPTATSATSQTISNLRIDHWGVGGGSALSIWILYTSPSPRD